MKLTGWMTHSLARIIICFSFVESSDEFCFYFKEIEIERERAAAALRLEREIAIEKLNQELKRKVFSELCNTMVHFYV